jgi:hypothetical protein
MMCLFRAVFIFYFFVFAFCYFQIFFNLWCASELQNRTVFLFYSFHFLIFSNIFVFYFIFVVLMVCLCRTRFLIIDFVF